MALIGDIAVVCKSKNAGPFEVTIDAVFADEGVTTHVNTDQAI